MSSELRINNTRFSQYLYIFSFFGLFIHLFLCAYIIWAISPLCPHPLPLPSTPLASRQNLFLPLLQFHWREDISNNKKDIAFLLVWDKGSYTERFLAFMHKCVTTRIGSSLPDLFTISRSPSHSGLCLFKITLFTLYSGYIKHFKVLGFLPFPYSSSMCSLLIVWPRSNNITAFVLGQ
jgi:hypothetical protein